MNMVLMIVASASVAKNEYSGEDQHDAEQDANPGGRR